MKKYLASFLALCLLVAAGASASAAIVEQELKGPNFKPKKLKKKKFKKGEVTVRTTLPGIEDGDEIPQKATKVNIAFPKKDIKFKPKATKACKADLEGTSRTDALEACRKAKVSKDKQSRAEAALPFGPGGTASVVPAEVMAFNGGKKGKGGKLILWSRVNSIEVTTILPSVLTKKNVLKVTVPLLAGGTAAITDFQARVKKGAYVRGRCKSNRKRMKIKGTFKYADAPTQKVKSRSKIKKCKR